MQFIAGVEARLSPRSIGLTLQLVDSVEEEIEVYRRWFGEHRVDGVFVVDPQHDDPRVGGAPRARPARGRDRRAARGRPPAGRLARRGRRSSSRPSSYLAALGHRRIARVSGVAEFVHTAAANEGVPRDDARARAPRRGRGHRLHARERCPRDAAAALVAGAADGDHLRQRPPRRHRPRGRAADGIHRPRRPLADRVGRLADQPRRPPAAHGDHPRHRGVRRDRRAPICSP